MLNTLGRTNILVELLIFNDSTRKYRMTCIINWIITFVPGITVSKVGPFKRVTMFHLFFLHVAHQCAISVRLYFAIGGQYSEFSFATSKMKMAADYDNLLTSLASQTCWFPADVFCCSYPNAKNWCPLISFYRKLSLNSTSFKDLFLPWTSHFSCHSLERCFIP